jgi:hypothetical protein
MVFTLPLFVVLRLQDVLRVSFAVKGHRTLRVLTGAGSVFLFYFIYFSLTECKFEFGDSTTFIPDFTLCKAKMVDQFGAALLRAYRNVNDLHSYYCKIRNTM